MIHQLAEQDAERADVGRQQQIGAAGGLAAALEGAVVHGAHLVGMVAEVGGRSRIIEREHGTDEQRTLVVTYRERAAEGGTRFAIGHVAVGKKDAAGCRETVFELAELSHEAVGQLDAAVQPGTSADDGVLANHARADDDGILDGAADGAVAQSRHAAQLASVIDNGVDDDTGVDDAHVVADGAAFGSRSGYRVGHHAFDGVHQRLVLSVLDHQGRQLTVKFI